MYSVHRTDLGETDEGACTTLYWSRVCTTYARCAASSILIGRDTTPVEVAKRAESKSMYRMGGKNRISPTHTTHPSVPKDSIEVVDMLSRLLVQTTSKIPVCFMGPRQR